MLTEGGPTDFIGSGGPFVGCDVHKYAIFLPFKSSYFNCSYSYSLVSLIQVEFRPWAGIVVPPSMDYAMSLTWTRRIVWLVTDPVCYLGERVMRQHSSDELVVPMDPPPTMMNDDLKKSWDGPHSSAGVGLD